jgi:peptide chain release factor 2
MRILKARLLELKLKELEKEKAEQRGQKKAITWGSQIRSYVMAPYTLVKDHRTEVETGNCTKVLDGDINAFIQAYLAQKELLRT